MDARDDERTAEPTDDAVPGPDDDDEVWPEPDHDALIAQLRASGSVFAEEEYAVLLAHAEALGAGDPEEVAHRLDLCIDRRVHGERIEHIVERAQFAELSVEVDFGVFVPRSRTVLLATIVADRLGELQGARGAEGPPPRLLDFGCGSGAIAALTTHRVPGIEVVAVDSDQFAIVCARRNLPHARLVTASSILALVDADSPDGATTPVDAADAVPPRRISASAPYDVIAANLPYVPTSQLQLLPRGTLESEPLTALDGGADGLDPLGEHALAMCGLLRDGGMLITEIAPHQAELGIEILELAGFEHIELRDDDELDATVLIGRR